MFRSSLYRKSKTAKMEIGLALGVVFHILHSSARTVLLFHIMKRFMYTFKREIDRKRTLTQEF